MNRDVPSFRGRHVVVQGMGAFAMECARTAIEGGAQHVTIVCRRHGTVSICVEDDAVAGFYELTGWPDLPPAGPWMAYTDPIAPRFVASPVLAALDPAPG